MLRSVKSVGSSVAINRALKQHNRAYSLVPSPISAFSFREQL
jgi:hypothetical protein